MDGELGVVCDKLRHRFEGADVRSFYAQRSTRRRADSKGARVQSFVPLLVERAARRELHVPDRDLSEPGVVRYPGGRSCLILW